MEVAAIGEVTVALLSCVINDETQ